MFCTRCGKELDDVSLFCPYCGVEVGQTKEVIEKIEQEKDNETNIIDLKTKVVIGLTIIVALLSFLPYSVVMAYIGLFGSLVLAVISIVLYIKNRSKYNMFLFILNIVLLITNINTIVLYSILK